MFIFKKMKEKKTIKMTASVSFLIVFLYLRYHTDGLHPVGEYLRTYPGRIVSTNTTETLKF